VAGVTLPDMRPWGRRPLTIPPHSTSAWVQLAVYEIWIGTLVCVFLGLGVSLITSSPHHIVTVSDLSNCYGPPPVALPCERIVYRGGALDAAFTALCGLMLIGVAAWFLVELWTAVEPRPITDDFLRLLNDSFGSNWRNPLKWPWARMLWAYGFTIVGAMLTIAVGMTISTFLASAPRTPTAKIETSQSYRLGQ